MRFIPGIVFALIWLAGAVVVANAPAMDTASTYAIGGITAIGGFIAGLWVSDRLGRRGLA